MAAFTSPRISSLHLPDDFVYLSDLLPDVLLDVRYHGSDNFVGAPIDGYEAATVILTAEAATALRDVQRALEDFGLGLKVFDGYRPQRAVDQFVHWARDLQDERTKAQYYPNVAKADLIPDGFIATQSAHSRGSTVDLTLVSLEGQEPAELDMGTPFDYFDFLSFPGSQSVTGQQRANRLLLQTLMGRYGFAPLAQEWWHFTLENEPFPDTYFDFPVR